VLTHPFQMTLWAFLIMGFSLLGMGSLFIGLVFIVPMLGHGSWHAYRQMVDVSEITERLTEQGACCCSVSAKRNSPGLA